jgi:hypothetical protein
LLAGKDIENRNWAKKVRGPILIHAAKGMTRTQYIDAMEFAFAINKAWAQSRRADTRPFDFNNLPRGGIISGVILVDCVQRDKSNSPWFQGAYGFVLRDPKPLPFYPYKGQLGFFDVPDVLP